MNANRLIMMAIRYAMRFGTRRMSAGQKCSPQLKQAQKMMRLTRWMGR